MSKQSPSKPNTNWWVVLEKYASQLLRDLKYESTPNDAFRIAGLLDVPVRAMDAEMRAVFPEKRHACLIDGEIYLDTSKPIERQNFCVAHELAHLLFKRELKWPEDEDRVDFLASCLMLPYWNFKADLAREGWDLSIHRLKHHNCSWQMLAHRISSIHMALVTVWDNGELTKSIRSPWMYAYADLQPLEKALVRHAFETGDSITAADRAAAYAVFDHETGWERVITVVDPAMHRDLLAEVTVAVPVIAR